VPPRRSLVLSGHVDALLSELPVVGVLGNHDCESGQETELRHILGRSGMKMLDVEPAAFQGIGFTGVKGFAGGFDTHALQAWGEPIVKQFVQESLDEALRLERGLGRLQTEHGVERKVAVLHYAPVHGTVEGEPAEIIPFLGSSRLAEPIDRFAAAAVVHERPEMARIVPERVATRLQDLETAAP